MERILATVSEDDFLLPPPCVVNEHLIPDNIRRAMSPGWDSGKFKHRPIRIMELKDVYLLGEGLAVSRSGDPVLATTAQYTKEQIASALSVLEQKRDQAAFVGGRSLLARKRGDHNYGHWLVECIPKACISVDAGIEFDAIIVPANSSAMRTVVDDSLDLAGLGSFDTIREPNDTPTLYETLLVVDGVTRHGTYMSPLALRPLERMRATQPGSGLKRVFIRRTGVVRCLSNEDRLCSALAAQGFISIDPSRMTLRQQITMLKDADVVIGAMGAAMTNIVFAHSGALIINLAPAVMPDTFFYFLATHRKQRYVEIRCDIDEQAKGRASDFSTPIETVVKTLETHLPLNWHSST